MIVFCKFYRAFLFDNLNYQGSVNEKQVTPFLKREVGFFCQSDMMDIAK